MSYREHKRRMRLRKFERTLLKVENFLLKLEYFLIDCKNAWHFARDVAGLFFINGGTLLSYIGCKVSKDYQTQTFVYMGGVEVDKIPKAIKGVTEK